jgi:hypothetical protein
MPYIPAAKRDELDASAVDCVADSISSVGDLNYTISKIVSDRLEIAAHVHGRLRYADLNAAIGALECAKLELYRRLGAGLEDVAIERNGDLQSYEILDKVITREMRNARGNS